MKKEQFLVTAAVFFLVSYLIDRLAGPVSIVVKNPFIFVSQSIFLKYPFTSLAISLKFLGLAITIILFLSFIEKAYFTKACVTFFLALFAELYAIQQTATRGTTTSILWTLAFAYTGILLIIPTVYYFLKGLLLSLHSSLSEGKKALPNDPLQDKDSQT